MVRTALVVLALALFGGAPYAGSLANMAVIWAADETDAGGHADPDGLTTNAGNHFDPNGLKMNGGSLADPDGASTGSDAGSLADPNG